MRARSVRGLLLTLLVVCAVVALGLGAVRSLRPSTWATTFGDVAALLYGWRIVSATLALGLGVWVGGVGIEAVGGTRAARWAAVLMVLASPWLIQAAEALYWTPREYVSVWRVDGGSSDQRAGLWRGFLGGECSYGHIVEIRFGADGRGRGRAILISGFDNGFTAAIALSPLTGPHSIPVEAVLQGGEMTVWSASETIRTAPVVDL